MRRERGKGELAAVVGVERAAGGLLNRLNAGRRHNKPGALRLVGSLENEKLIEGYW
jgi:hypothetical protein